MIRVRRTARPTEGSGSRVAPAPPVPRLSDEITYKGYQIEPGSYSVGNGNWSPRAVVLLRPDEGAWRRTPLYSTSAAKFPTRDEADRRALDVAKAWIDAAVEQQRPPAA